MSSDTNDHTAADLTKVLLGGRPAWRHTASGVVFRQVPGGTFQMGLSDAELQALRGIVERCEDDDEGATWWIEHPESMRPVRSVTVEPFLMARHPLTVAQVRHWLPDYDDGLAQDDATAARVETALDDLVDRMPFHLPTEAQWEYAARAATTTLTYRGDGLPSECDLLDRFAVEAEILASENPFGLAAMGSLGEVCADTYVSGYDGAPNDGTARTGDGPRVARGGAADLSPWQGCDEWLLMLSAARGPHSMFAAVRPVLSITAIAHIS